MRKINQFELCTEDLEISNFEDIFIPEGDYGLAKITLNSDRNGYVIAEIPMYGGEPIMHFNSNPNSVVEMIHSWT